MNTTKYEKVGLKIYSVISDVNGVELNRRFVAETKTDYMLELVYESLAHRASAGDIFRKAIKEELDQVEHDFNVKYPSSKK